MDASTLPTVQEALAQVPTLGQPTPVMVLAHRTRARLLVTVPPGSLADRTLAGSRAWWREGDPRGAALSRRPAAHRTWWCWVRRA